MWRFLGLLAILLGVTGVILWYAGLIQIGAEIARTPKNGENAATGGRNQVPSPLPFPPAEKSTLALSAAAPRPDLITIPDMVLSNVNETEISSRIDARIRDVLVKPGDTVRVDQRLAVLDDTVALQAELLAKMEWESYKEKIKGAELQHQAMARICAQDDQAKGAVAEQEKLINRTRRDKALSDILVAKEEQRLAEQKMVKTQKETEYYYITSNREGRVEKIYSNRKSGEMVRVGEPLFKIVDVKKLRADGAVESQVARHIQPGMRAVVEPEIPLGPHRRLRYHAGPVTDVAVTSNGRLLLSASKDQFVIVWSLEKDHFVTRLSTSPSEEIYAIACGPIQAGNQGQLTYTFLAGCAHGRTVLWRVTLDANDKVVGQPEATELTDVKNGHRDRQPIRCAAFRQDGKYAATGGEDFQICIWDVENGKLLYRVRETSDAKKGAHHGSVTTVHFTPDGHLLSAGSDKVWKKWRLGPDYAELVLPDQKNRAGDVARLGMTHDGRRVLFDYGAELRILDASDNWNPLAALHNLRQGRFQNFAVFSPSGQMVLTVGAGRLQLWSIPSAPDDSQAAETTARRSRCHEWRQLIVPDASNVTCGAFYAPAELGPTAPAGASAYAFTGSDDGSLQIWQLPSLGERQQPIVAVITHVGGQVERGGPGMVAVRAEFDNPADPRRLLAGSHVNLTVNPETARK